MGLVRHLLYASVLQVTYRTKWVNVWVLGL